MIHALDHIVLAAPSVDAAVADYRLLLGRRADGASFQLANVRLDLRAHDGAAARACRPSALPSATWRRPSACCSSARCLSPKPTRVANRRCCTSLRRRRMGLRSPSLARSSGNGVSPLSPLESAEEAGAVASLDHVVDPLAQPGARHRSLRRAPGAQPAPRPHGAGMGRAPPLLPLRRSHHRGRARSEGRDRRRAGSAVGPVLARTRYRQGSRAAAGSRRRRFRHPRRPPSAHARLHGAEPYSRRADADDRPGPADPNLGRRCLARGQRLSLIWAHPLLLVSRTLWLLPFTITEMVPVMS